MHPYPAKFIPHIPRALIAAYARHAGIVWDPMCGSGTSLIEASITGRLAVGTDLNPIATLISRAKTIELHDDSRAALRAVMRTLAARSSAVRKGQPVPEAPIPEFRNRDHWFSNAACMELADSKRIICEAQVEEATIVGLCAFSAIIVGVSNQESETRWRAVPTTVAPGDVYARLEAKIRDSLARLEAYAATCPEPVTVALADARATDMESETVDFVVTSPPYANSHDYYLYNKLRLFWLNHAVHPIQDAEIGSRNRHSDRKEGVETYLDAMELVLGEIQRVLRPDGVASIVVGDAVIRGVLHDMGALLGDRASAAGLLCVDHFSFAHTRFNAAFQRGFGTTSRKLTHVLVFQRG
jgi:DNA methylase